MQWTGKERERECPAWLHEAEATLDKSHLLLALSIGRGNWTQIKMSHETV